MTQLDILLNDDINKQDWSGFVQHHPLGSVFQSPEIYNVYKHTSHNHPYAIAALKNGEIKGLLLAVVFSNGNCFTRSFTARSIIVGGPLVENDDEEVCQRLLQAYNKLIGRKVIYSEIRPIFDIKHFNNVLEKLHFLRKGHYNLILDLNIGEEKLWDNLHKERRRNINQAQKAGLHFKVVTADEEIRQVYELIYRTYKRKHVPQSYSDVFNHLHSKIGSVARYFAAYYNGEMIAGQIRLCYKDMVYQWFAGSDETYFKLRPNDFLTWNVIRWACEQGYGIIDLGGGGEPGVPYGVRDYKLKYGCQIYDYGRYEHIHKPILFRIGKLGVKLLGMKR